MIHAILTDFSHVLLFAKDAEYAGSLNALYDVESEQEGFDYWNVFELNTELLEFYRMLNNTVPVYIFTTGTVQADPAIFPMLKESCTDIFAAKELGVNKKEKETYIMMCKKIGFKPEDVLYIDDKQAHVEIAEEAGLYSFQHISTEETILKLQALGISNYTI